MKKKMGEREREKEKEIVGVFNHARIGFKRAYPCFIFAILNF